MENSIKSISSINPAITENVECSIIRPITSGFEWFKQTPLLCHQKNKIFLLYKLVGDIIDKRGAVRSIILQNSLAVCGPVQSGQNEKSSEIKGGGQ